MSRRTEIVLLVATLAVAAVLRLAYLFEQAQLPEFRHPMLDDQYHDYWARCLAFGPGELPAGVNDPHLATTPYFRPPGYPFFLAAVYRVLGTSPFAPRLIQIGLGVFSCMLLYLLARRITRSAAVGLLTALLAATSWQLIYYEATLHAPVLLVLLAILLILLLARLGERPLHSLSLAAGVTLGLFALVRPDILPFGAAAVFWMAWVSARNGWRTKLLPIVLTFCVGVGVCIAPVTIRNHVVAKDTVLISANGGINLFFGNNARSDGVSASHPDVGAWSCFDYPRIVDDLGRKMGRHISYSEANKYYIGQVRAFIWEAPGQAFRLTMRKAILFWSAHEIASENDIEYERGQSRLLRHLPLSFAGILALAIVGAGFFAVDCFARRSVNREEVVRSVIPVVLVLAFIVVYSVTQIAFIVSGRYRLPLLPFLLIGAAYAGVQLVRVAVRGKTDQALVCGFLLAGVYAMVIANPVSYHHTSYAGPLHQALVHERAGETDSAIATLIPLVKSGEANAEVYFCLGNLLANKGRDEEAIVQLRHALELDRGYLAAHVRLGKVMGKRGSFAEAANCFRAALSISPSDAEAHACLGITLSLGRSNDKGEALTHLLEGLKGGRDLDTIHFCIGGILLEQGDIKGAEDHFAQGLQANPGDVAAWLHVAKRWLSCGEKDRARSCLKQVLRLEQGNAEASLLLTQLGDPAK